MTDKLSPKHRRFVIEYLKDQNSSAAARRAGYKKKNSDVVGPRLLGYVGIKQAIDDALSNLERKGIADRTERQRFWTETMQDRSIEIQHRLKASELLGRSEADFTDKMMVSLNLESLLSKSDPPKEKP